MWRADALCADESRRPVDGVLVLDGCGCGAGAGPLRQWTKALSSDPVQRSDLGIGSTSSHSYMSGLRVIRASVARTGPIDRRWTPGPLVLRSTPGD